MPIFSANWDRLHPVCLQYRFRIWEEYLSLIAMLVCGFDYKYKCINETDIFSGKILDNINGLKKQKPYLANSRFKTFRKEDVCAFLCC